VENLLEMFDVKANVGEGRFIPSTNVTLLEKALATMTLEQRGST
jgi:hypothetical protein